VLTSEQRTPFHRRLVARLFQHPIREVTMSQTTDSLRDSLLSHNEEYRRLLQEHHEFESRLTVLSDKAVLSEDEQVEETTLKKRKLQIKDKMEAIARQARSAHA
jgi:uncharacterized protein YdcH (DUF465 family)